MLSSAAYLERLNAPTDWTRRALAVIRRMVRNAYRLVAAGTDVGGDALVTVRIQPHSGRGPAVRAWLADQAWAALGDLTTGSGLYESDSSATSVATEERRIVGGEVTAAPPFLALCAVNPGGHRALQEFWETWSRKMAADVTVDGYRLLYGLAWLGASEANR